MARELSVVDDDGDPVVDAHYRKTYCTDCERVFTANRLIKIRVKEVSGTSSGYSRSTPNLFNRRRYSGTTRHSSRTYYKFTAKRLCAECYTEEMARQRRALIGKGAMWIAGIGLFLYLGSTSQHTSSTTTIASAPNASNVISEPASPVPTTESSTQPAAYEPKPVQLAPPTIQAPLDLPQPIPLPLPEPLFTVTYLANVRAAPNNGPVIGQAVPGEELAVAETRGSWAEVRRGDEIIGWIHRSLLQRSR